MSIIEKRNKGITIIALVVTIVIVIILSGITVSTIKGDGGLLQQIKEEKENVETKSNLVENKIQELEEKFNNL